MQNLSILSCLSDFVACSSSLFLSKNGDLCLRFRKQYEFEIEFGNLCDTYKIIFKYIATLE